MVTVSIYDRGISVSVNSHVYSRRLVAVWREWLRVCLGRHGDRPALTSCGS